MFDIGWSELLVIAVVAIVVVGPKELPRLLRTFGRYAGKLKRAASDFQHQFEDAMRESELDEMRKALDDVRSTAESVDLGRPIDQPLMLKQPTPAPSPSQPPKPARKRPAPRKAASAKPAAKTKAAPRKPRKPPERTP